MYRVDVVDEHGLVRENMLLTVVIPGECRALVFRVRYRKVFIINYAPLPVSSGEPLALYPGGVVYPPADGVMPAMSYTFHARTFPMPGAYDPTDMFYIPSDWKDTIFHVHHYLRPAWLRVDIQIPPDNVQLSFQRNKIPAGLDQAFGFYRGHIEVIHLPNVKVGYRFGNDTSVTVYTADRMVVGEYNVELVTDPEVIFDAIIGKIPAYTYTLPVFRTTTYVLQKIVETYGIEGFPIYPPYKREQAIKEYREIIEKVKK